MTDVVGEALARYAAECAAEAHALCDHTEDCQRALAVHRAEAAESAMPFDASQEVLRYGDRWPDERWSTPALLWLVKTGALQPPHRDPLRRTMLVTTALARLGERGLPPDAVLRTCLGPALLRRIIIEAGAVWTLVRDGKVRRDRLGRIEDWLRLLDAEPGLQDPGELTTSDVISAALRGNTIETARRWLNDAAVAHLLGWRLDGYQVTQVRTEDLALPAGAGATRWVVDRFTETYVERWARASLDWELVYLHEPERTATRVGLPLAMLRERQVARGQLLAALSRRLSGADADDPAAADFDTAEIVEAIVEKFRSGDARAAHDLAEMALRDAPDNPHLINALAFCLLPHDPARAAALLERSARAVDPRARAAAAANRVTLHLFAKDADSAELSLASVPDDGNQYVWCWDPGGIGQGEAQLTSMSFADWRSSVRALIDRLRA